MKDFGIIIPARFASSRLPGKPLREIAGRPMIQWVVENAQKANSQFVVVATDDERIAESVHAFGGDVIMTSTEHTTGTDRLAEVVRERNISGNTIIVNVQGDEPLLEPHYMQLVAETLASHTSAGIATLASPISDVDELFNANIVKVVTDKTSNALYFSRAPLPWSRDSFAAGPPSSLPSRPPFLRHVGLYAYRAQALRDLSLLPPTLLEEAESLEQLRALHHGISINVAVVQEAPAHGVDTEADLAHAEASIRRKRTLG